MATIVIGPSASSGYPLASDNVFGPPSTVTVTSTSGEIVPLGVPDTYTDGETTYYTYPSGLLPFAINWINAGVPTTTTLNFDLGPVSGSYDFIIGQQSASAYQVRTDGITFTPNTPIFIFEYTGHGSSGPLFMEGVRTFDATYPATALAYADTITNLSATGALLRGYAGADTITGGTGNDTLDGGTGIDSLVGGLGDDSYYVDFADKVVEAAGQGFDTVYTAGTYVAQAGVWIERVVATGTAAVALTGNGQAIELIGNSGINTLDDGGGAATLKGGAGNDVYVVHNAATQVVELSGEGYDGVRTDLSAYTLGANLETLTHLGATAFQGTGNSLSNNLTGGTGSDTLNGAGGNDVLTGGLGADHFRFSGLTFGQDQITDFLSGTDVIELSGAGFGLASLAGVQLVADGTATAAGQATLHYYANGGLSFDANGGAAGDAVFFATLSGHPSLAISDFQLV